MTADHTELLATLKRHGWDRRMPADFEGITRYTELPRIEVQTDQTSLIVEHLPYAQHTKWWYHEDHGVEGVVDDGYVCWALRSAILRCSKDAIADMVAQKAADSDRTGYAPPSRANTLGFDIGSTF